MNMPLVLLNRRRRAGVFNPVNVLFNANEVGAVYDPSDLTTLFQDTAGTQPVTTPGQTVALALDKSKGLVLGAELVTNGGFATDTDWTKGTGWTISGGVATTASGNSGTLDQAITVVAGRTYRIDYTITGWVSGQAQLGFSGGTTVLGPLSGTGNGARSIFVTAVTGNNTFRVFKNSSPDTFSIDNISVRELAGNHATQSTAAARPIYGVHPFGGRRNLLTWTEQFDNAAWVKSNCTFSSGVVTTTTNNDGLAQAITNYASNESHAITWRVSAGTATWLRLVVFQTAASTNRISCWFNVSTGSAGSATNGGSGTGATLSFNQVSAGVYDVTLVGAVNNAATAVTVQVSTATADQSTTGVSGVSYGVQRAQLETGSTATPYQRVGSQYDVTEAGVPSVSYLYCGGASDPRWMLTPTITPNIDKAQVFAGVRKLSDAAAGVVAELSASSASNNGALTLSAPFDPAITALYGFASRGTVRTVAATLSGFNAPISNVLTGLGDISGDIATLRINGTQAAQNTGDQGTGNYLAYPLYIGMRGGSSLPLFGHIYSLVVRFGANLSTDQITATERWVASKTGVLL